MGVRSPRWFFDQRRIVLGHLVHLADGGGDFGNGARLFLAGGRHALDQRGAFAHPSSIEVSFWVASETSLEPLLTSLADCSISTLTSEEALAADWARRRTSTAIEQTEGQANELDRIVEVFVVDGVARAPARSEPAPHTAKPGGIRALQAKVKSASKSYLTQGNAAIKQDWSEF